MISHTNGQGGMRGLLASIAGDGGWDDGGIRNTESKAGHPGLNRNKGMETEVVLTGRCETIGKTGKW